MSPPHLTLTGRKYIMSKPWKVLETTPLGIGQAIVKRRIYNPLFKLLAHFPPLF
jgi:hypothetical protein